MMKFIELTRAKDKTVVVGVRVDHITHFYQNKTSGKTFVNFAGSEDNFVSVDESVAEVKKIISGENKERSWTVV
jgi:hypothetical protein